MAVVRIEVLSLGLWAAKRIEGRQETHCPQGSGRHGRRGAVGERSGDRIDRINKMNKIEDQNLVNPVNPVEKGFP
jgi:hypothetical protein